jgi:septum site-determining protein MinC
LSTEIASASLVEFKGTTVPAMRVLLRSVDVASLRAALAAALDARPGFFENELAVVDLSAIEDEGQDVDWEGIFDALHDRGLRLVGVSNALGSLGDSALAAGLAAIALRGGARPRATAPDPRRELDLERKAAARDAAEAAPVPARAGAAPPPAPPEPLATPASEAPDVRVLAVSPTLIVERPLRSGQQIYASGADVVLLAMTNAGSEVIADGSIHIYAPLRGRALAGAHGDVLARIFTTSFEAELVSIAGVYRTFEQGIPAEIDRQPAQVRLVVGDRGEQSLLIEPLSVS